MRRVPWLAAALVLGGSTVAAQSDHYNLEHGLPTRLEDAYPIGYRGREAQLVTRYARTDESEDQVLLEPAFELGFARNWQGRVSVPFLAGDADRRGSGDVRLEALYNVNQESDRLPALALAGGIDLPTGRRSEGLDTRLKVLLTRSVDDQRLGRAHLNLEWAHNAEAHRNERDDAFTAVLGYSFLVTPDLLAVADVYREWELVEDVESNVVEGGLRYQLHPRTVLSVGAGIGLGDESPDALMTLSLQVSL